MELEQVFAYKRSFNISNKLWDEVRRMDHFSKVTVGQQIVRSVDSISANIAEGFGRYNKKNKIRFYRIAYSSNIESRDW